MCVQSRSLLTFREILIVMQDKAATDNRATQLNPNSGAYASTRSGQPKTPAENPANDNHANQLNPNHAEFKGGAEGSNSAKK